MQSRCRSRPATIARGAALFPVQCARCHGATGRGDGPDARALSVAPADLTAQHLWNHSDRELFGWLSRGIERPQGTVVMPGFADVLPESDRWALIDFLRARFLVMRSMTAPEFRRTHAQIALALPTMTMLEQWSKAHPEERVAGLIAFVEPGAWGEAARLPRGPYFGWTLVAYTHDGKQVRVVWFDHYRVGS